MKKISVIFLSFFCLLILTGCERKSSPEPAINSCGDTQNDYINKSAECNEKSDMWKSCRYTRCRCECTWK